MNGVLTGGTGADFIGVFAAKALYKKVFAPRRVPIIKIEEKSIIKRLCHIYLGLCIFPESFVVLRSTLGEGVGSAEVIVISVDFPIINSHLHTT